METSDLAGVFIITFLISFLLFLVLRQLNTWYWKINERVKLQWKTNILLEKILIQLDATNPDEVIVEEIKTGKKKSMKIDEFITLITDGSNATKYRSVRT